MRFISKDSASSVYNSNWYFNTVMCFNFIRNDSAFKANYWETNKAKWIGTFREIEAGEETAAVTQSIKLLKKAIKVIPMLNIVKYEVLNLEDEPNENATYAALVGKTLHTITVPTENVPADHAMSAIFLARYILQGHFLDRLRMLEQLNKEETEPNARKFNMNKLWNNNKYFISVLFYLAAFKPSRTHLRGFYKKKYGLTFELWCSGGDGYVWVPARTSLYSLVTFYKGTINFIQEPLAVQHGYYRNTSTSDHDRYREALTQPSFRLVQRDHYGSIRRDVSPFYTLRPETHREDSDVVLSMATVMSQGECRENFLPDSEYALDPFLTDAGEVTEYQTLKQVLDLLDHMVSLLSSSTVTYNTTK